MKVLNPRYRMPPNAGRQLLGAAGARDERTLFPVSWTPLLGVM